MPNAADPLHVSSEGLPALNDAELAVLIGIGEAGGMWPRHKLDPAAVKSLLDAALLWPKGTSAVALTAKGIQTPGRDQLRTLEHLHARSDVLAHVSIGDGDDRLAHRPAGPAPHPGPPAAVGRKPMTWRRAFFGRRSVLMNAVRKWLQNRGKYRAYVERERPEGVEVLRFGSPRAAQRWLAEHGHTPATQTATP